LSTFFLDVDITPKTSFQLSYYNKNFDTNKIALIDMLKSTGICSFFFAFVSLFGFFSVSFVFALSLISIKILTLENIQNY